MLEHFKFERIDQALVVGKDKYFDVLKVKAPDGKEKSIYFDISLFYGKSSKSQKSEPAKK